MAPDIAIFNFVNGFEGVSLRNIAIRQEGKKKHRHGAKIYSGSFIL